MSPAVTPDDLFTPPGQIDFRDYSPEFGYRQLSAAADYIDPCARSCGTATCAFFNSSFSCERLNGLSCMCEGCCFHAAEPLGVGAVFLLFLFCMWCVFMFCNCYYRWYAVRETKEIFDGQPPRNDEIGVDEDGVFYANGEKLTEEQATALRRRRRYQLSFLNVVAPYVALCCPGMHRMYFEATNNMYSEAKESCMNFKGEVKENVVLAKQKTAEALVIAEAKANKAANYVGEGLKESNLTGITLHSATAMDHGKKSTSTRARGVLNKDKSGGSSGSSSAFAAGMDVAGVTADDETDQGMDAIDAIDAPPALDVPKAVGRLAYALVAVAQGGTADIRGSPEEIELAAERLEKAAYEAREKACRAQGKAPTALHGHARGFSPAGGSSARHSRASVLLAITAASSTTPTGGGGAADVEAVEEIQRLQTQLNDAADKLAAEMNGRAALEAEVRKAKDETAAAAQRADAAEASVAAAEAKVAEAVKEAADAKMASSLAEARAEGAMGVSKAAADAIETAAAKAATPVEVAVEAVAEVTALAEEVANEVEAEASASVENVMKPNFRASFAGRLPAGPGTPNKRASFLQIAVRQSQAHKRDSWAEAAEDEEDDNDAVATPGGSLDEILEESSSPAPTLPSKPRSTASRLFGRGKKKAAGGGSPIEEESTRPSQQSFHNGSERASTDRPPPKTEKEARLRKLEDAQRRAEEAQKRAAEYEEELQRSVAADAGASSGAKPGFIKRMSSAVRGSKDAGRMGGKAPSIVPEEPKWAQLLTTYTEQLEQIEQWLTMEPTEEEVADGSAMEKAMTLLTAREDLTAKIQQLEAVAAAHNASESGARPRQTSVSGTI